uniref:Uncharacterized protein n=1 Tax=uncultured prokaryote TaxID=198431 RepID=A0A0H5QK32_9ZZZZ|nr:hypothetical protein [uncultured prokaryote]
MTGSGIDENSNYDRPDGLTHFPMRQLGQRPPGIARGRTYVALESIGETCADRDVCRNLDSWLCVCLEDLLRPEEENPPTP